MNQSQTPETDAAILWGSNTLSEGYYVRASFAKDLELQRNKAIHQSKLGWERNAETDAAYGNALAQRDALMSALEALLAKVECGSAIDCGICSGARSAISAVKGGTK